MMMYDALKCYRISKTDCIPAEKERENLEKKNNNKNKS